MGGLKTREREAEEKMGSQVKIRKRKKWARGGSSEPGQFTPANSVAACCCTRMVHL